MGRIEGPPVGEISESMQKRRGYIKGVPVLKPANVELVRAGEEKGLIDELPSGLQEVLLQRYPGEGKPRSLSDIGSDTNITREAVRQKEARALRKIRRLLEGKRQTNAGRPRDDIDVNEVVRLYTVEEKTMREIADLMTCSKDVISGRLRAAGTPTRRGRRKIKININLLARQYIAEEMSADEIAKPLDISAKTVLQRLSEAGVKTRPGGRRKLDLDLSLMRQLYVDDNKSLEEIEEIMHVSGQTISNRLKSIGVSLRRGGPRKK
ncbi:MAG: hypothetical protein A3B44_00420 [Candidatus Levybacteria bacterium RIFCSPLOWO2_01_FULL_38_21]|nr:MAG: hypothetical protein A3B44_00420 [Candidatus Levybacteria bacterium RIFCSPLOWO2_01_FULL_38_21]